MAAIDIGSNTVHLLVGRLKDRERVEHLASESELLELGREVQRHGELRKRKLRDLKDVLRHHLKVAKKLRAREVLIAATGAVREARNGVQAMRELERELDVSIQILSGTTEARLSFLGSTPDLHREGPQLLIDSGGASTEVTLTRGRTRRAAVSLPVGASLLCHEIKEDPPGPLEWANLAIEIGDAMRRLPTAPRPERALAVGGAAHRLEEMHPGGPGKPVSLDDLEGIARRLLRHRSKRIARQTGIERKKVVLLAAGALILHALLRHYGLNEVRIGHAGLRDGMILKHARVGGNWWRAR